jgi:hypothetical protein
MCNDVDETTCEWSWSAFCGTDMESIMPLMEPRSSHELTTHPKTQQPLIFVGDTVQATDDVEFKMERTK